MIDKVSVEGIISVGLVAALLLCIYTGDDKLANDVAIGLIGYMSRQVVAKKGDKE